MERTGDWKSPDFNPRFPQVLDCRLDSLPGARNDRLSGSVDISDPNTFDRLQDIPNALLILGHGSHCSQILILPGCFNNAATARFREGVQRFFAEYACSTQGDVFTVAVTGDHIRFDAQNLEQLKEAHARCPKPRLGYGSLGEGLLARLVFLC